MSCRIDEKVEVVIRIEIQIQKKRNRGGIDNLMWGNGVAPYIVSVLPDLEHSRVGGIVHFNNQEDFNRIRACLTHREPGGGLCERDPLSYIRNPSRGTRECVIQRRRRRGVCDSGITQIDIRTRTKGSCRACNSHRTGRSRRACKCGSGRSSPPCRSCHS